MEATSGRRLPHGGVRLPDTHYCHGLRVASSGLEAALYAWFGEIPQRALSTSAQRIARACAPVNKVAHAAMMAPRKFVAVNATCWSIPLD